MKIKQIYIISIAILLIFSGCTTPVIEDSESDPVLENEIQKEEQPAPYWLLNPPVEDNALFGIGIDFDLQKAKARSIINVGQQYGVQINSVLEEKIIETEEGSETVISSINSQITEQVVKGAKFVDQYQDTNKRYWVLTCAPVDCVLDMTESVILSYNLNILQERPIINGIIEDVEKKVISIERYYMIPPPQTTLIEGGTFQMGSNYGEDNEKPVHSVTVSSFRIGVNEVTQAEYSAVMGTNPSGRRFGIGENYPVNMVNWYDAVEYCNALSLKEGLTPCYSGSGRNISCNFDADGYRLPTEAEWEYASKGGSISRGYIYSGGNNITDFGWDTNNSENKTWPVGSKLANELGLNDMSGNVWEWCWDIYDDYSSENQSNPDGASSGLDRVRRGGGWTTVTDDCRSTSRGHYIPSFGFSDFGFRIVCLP